MDIHQQLAKAGRKPEDIKKRDAAAAGLAVNRRSFGAAGAQADKKKDASKKAARGRVPMEASKKKSLV